MRLTAGADGRCWRPALHPAPRRPGLPIARREGGVFHAPVGGLRLTLIGGGVDPGSAR